MNHWHGISTKIRLWSPVSRQNNQCKNKWLVCYTTVSFCHLHSYAIILHMYSSQSSLIYHSDWFLFLVFLVNFQSQFHLLTQLVIYWLFSIWCIFIIISFRITSSPSTLFSSSKWSICTAVIYNTPHKSRQWQTQKLYRPRESYKPLASISTSFHDPCTPQEILSSVQ